MDLFYQVYKRLVPKLPMVPPLPAEPDALCPRELSPLIAYICPRLPKSRSVIFPKQTRC